jgi:hypothetical protein
LKRRSFQKRGIRNFFNFKYQIWEEAAWKRGIRKFFCKQISQIWERRSFGEKRNKKILIFKYSNLGRGEAWRKKRNKKNFYF